MVFKIKTARNDHPFLVLADGFMSAVGILQREKNVYDEDIISVQQLDGYKSDHILVKDLILTEERLEEKVRRELAQKLPHWKNMPDGIAGGDIHSFLIRTQKGHYFTSSTVGGIGSCYYLNMDDLEQLPGIAEKEKEEVTLKTKQNV